MKKLTFLILIALSSNCYAGPGHDHSHGHSEDAPAISKEKTQEIGKQQIERLIKAGKLKSTWSKAIYDKSEKKVFSNQEEWVVTFTNEKEVEKKTLYIFLKQSGEFIAVNFTGK